MRDNILRKQGLENMTETTKISTELVAKASEELEKQVAEELKLKDTAANEELLKKKIDDGE